MRHLFAAYDVAEDKLFGHIKPRKTRARFLEFCPYLRSLYPPDVEIAIICDNAPAARAVGRGAQRRVPPAATSRCKPSHLAYLPDQPGHGPGDKYRAGPGIPLCCRRDQIIGPGR